MWNEDIVIRHTSGSTHNPRIEDWPVMPPDKMVVGLMLVKFFTGNPNLDIAVSTAKCKTTFTVLHSSLNSEPHRQGASSKNGYISMDYVYNVIHYAFGALFHVITNCRTQRRGKACSRPTSLPEDDYNTSSENQFLVLCVSTGLSPCKKVHSNAYYIRADLGTKQMESLLCNTRNISLLIILQTQRLHVENDLLRFLLEP